MIGIASSQAWSTKKESNMPLLKMSPPRAIDDRRTLGLISHLLSNAEVKFDLVSKSISTFAHCFNRETFGNKFFMLN